MNIQINSVATIDYRLTDGEGDEIDRAEKGEFSYLHGANNIIAGLENALNNKQAGDSFNISIEPKQAYGEFDPSLVQVVSAQMFGDAPEMQVGGEFHAESPKGEPIVVTIRDIDGDQVTIDGNHALAGVSLTFDVQVIAVREATKDEVEHGHVHSAEGCGGG